jgi:predicted GNAT superfamily acetyltransferase
MPVEERVTSPEFSAALDAFAPERFGFRRHARGWVKEFPGYGPVAMTAVGWQHAQSPSYDVVDGRRIETDSLGLIANLQSHVWGFPPELVVPTNIMAIIPDGGGSVLVAYRLDRGFNADGWIGFIIGLGARNGVLVSHMLAIREDARGDADFGWNLKLIQAYEALQTGHHAMGWTFDPMRGANARLNLEKLGATVRELSLDKYGVLRSSLYRNAPSDRFSAHWDLLAPRTRARVSQFRDGTYRPLSSAELLSIPEATPATIDGLLVRNETRVRYRIPGDIDELMERDPDRGVEWRNEMRTVLSALLTTKSVIAGEPAPDGPIAVGYRTSPGAYEVRGFVTTVDEIGNRDSQYVIERMTAGPVATK